MYTDMYFPWGCVPLKKNIKKKLVHTWIGFCTHGLKGFWFVLDTQTAIWRQKAAESSSDHRWFQSPSKHDTCFGIIIPSMGKVRIDWKRQKKLQRLQTPIKTLVCIRSSHEWAPYRKDWICRHVEGQSSFLTSFESGWEKMFIPISDCGGLHSQWLIDRFSYGCFHKWGYPRIIYFHGIFP